MRTGTNVADIFISYSRQDHGHAERLARALSSLGYELWWDVDLPNGVSWRRKIEEELELAKIVLVLWSRSARESDYVADEADFAKHAGKYAAVILDDSRPMFGFAQLQFDDLRKWNGEPNALRHLRFFKKLPKVDAQRPRTSTRSMSSLQDWRVEVAMYGILAAATNCTGAINAETAAALRYLAGSSRLLGRVPAPVMNSIEAHVDQQLEQARSQTIDIWLETLRSSRADPNTPNLEASLFAKVCHVIIADGVLTDTEKDFVAFLAQRLELPVERARELLQVLLTLNRY